jgi:uncharacterized protein (TIGR02147 family)
MKVFDYSNYKKYVVDLVASMPKKGRGQYSKIALQLKINTVVVSQIFSGTRDLTLEQAYMLTQFFGMNELEKEYFLNLVQKEKASHHELKKHFEQKLKEIKSKSQDLKEIIESQELDDEAKFQFYSQWYYSAIRLSTLLPGHNSAEAIAQKLKLPLKRVKEVVEFLLRYGLLAEEKEKLKIGPLKTHIGADSPYVIRHHTNWRMKSLENMESLNESEFFFTAPMVLSEEMMAELKRKILELVQDMQEKIKHAKDEKMACLNIDLFELE